MEPSSLMPHWLTNVPSRARTLWAESSSAIESLSHSVTKLFADAAANDPATADAHLDSLTDQDMEALMTETHDSAYPLMPHAPVVVAAASCEDVVLRWRAVENDSEWPIHGYVVQRFPGSSHKLEWETLIEAGNASESTDRNVRVSHQYLYRVQAISGAARSQFAYHAISMNQSSCYAGKTLLAYLPAALHSLPWVRSLSIEAVQTFVLIVSCFLAVFGVMRSNVKRVQHTRARSCRLKKMEKSVQEESSASKHYKLPRLSSSDTATETSTAPTETHSSSRSVQLDTSGPVDMAPRPASFSVAPNPSVCQFCHKKFGIFRRRRICDVCQHATLCRKCGVQAPVADATMDEMRESLLGPESNRKEKKTARSKRVKTICQDCCSHIQRFSTSTTVRTSHVPTIPLR